MLFEKKLDDAMAQHIMVKKAMTNSFQSAVKSSVNYMSYR